MLLWLRHPCCGSHPRRRSDSCDKFDCSVQTNFKQHKYNVTGTNLERDRDRDRDLERDLDGDLETLRLPDLDLDLDSTERDFTERFDAALRRERREATLPASEPLPE